MSINTIYINPTLKAVLELNGIDPSNYGPAYGGESAGLDLYYANLDEDLFIYPNATTFTAKPILIPTGVHIALPRDRVALVLERGSVSKTDLKVRAGVIDAGYSGEIFINCINAGSEKHRIVTGSKLPFQLLVVPVFNIYQLCDEETFKRLVETNKRGSGALGSSDTK